MRRRASSVVSTVVGRVGFAGPRTASEPLVLTVDATSDLGPSRLAPLLGLHAPTGGPRGPDDPVTAAWRAADLSRWRGVWLFGDRGDAIRVNRDAAGRPTLDWSGLEWVPDWIDAYGTPLFNVGFTPRALSFRPDHPEPWRFGPRYLDEWSAVVRDAVAGIRDRFGVRGARYEVLNEPDDDRYSFYGWNPRPGTEGSSYPTLDDYVALYIATARAIRAADPSAQVGGPVTSHWNAGPGGLGFFTWGLPDFLRRLGELNARTPPPLRVPLDFCDWHDYAWTSGPTGYAPDLDAGRSFVRTHLDANGFIGTRTLIVSEWNASTYFDLEAPGGQDRASHIAFNLIRQASRPDDDRIGGAFLYPFGGDDTSVAAVVHRDPRTGEVERSHTHAVYALLQAMVSGHRLLAPAPDPLAALAVRDDDGAIRVAISNHSTIRRRVNLSVVGVGDGPLEATLRILGAPRPVGDAGPTTRERLTLPATAAGARSDLDLPPRSAALFELAPRTLRKPSGPLLADRAVAPRP